MKTTIDLADGLFEETKRAAARRGTTMRALIEEGLRHVLAQPETTKPFVWRDLSVKGDGLMPGVDLSNWAQIRSIIYSDGDPE